MLDPKLIRISTVVTGTSWFPRTTGVKITHIPTGLSATSTEASSSHRNMHIAYEELVKLVDAFPIKEEMLELCANIKVSAQHITLPKEMREKLILAQNLLKEVYQWVNEQAP